MRSPNLIQRAVLLAAIFALLIPVVWIEYSILIQTHGTIAYPFDNTFYPLTVAKNFAFEHVWGISTYFTSASPSLLYTFLLSIIFLVTGAHLIVPLLVNGAIAILFLRAVQRRLIRENVKPGPQLLILLAVIWLIPLPLLIISGTEYTLLLFSTFLFIDNFVTAVATEKYPVKLNIYGLLMLSTSYQTLPILLIACVILVTRRHWWEGVKLLFISVLPVYLFGLVSMNKSGYFVPNQILIGWERHPLSIVSGSWSQLFPSAANPWPGSESWLIACSVIFVGILLAKYKHRTQRFVYPVTAVLAIALVTRCAFVYSHAASTCISTYEQQYQVAKFVRAYYGNYDHAVASNEIGAVSFWADPRRIFDLTGIGDLDVLHHIRDHSWTPAFADSLSEQRNINIAILHHTWSDTEVEPYWYRIATWQEHNDTVTFYSVNRSHIAQLQENLHAFEPRLPSDVTVRYYPPID
jgi:hypothetical protein